MSGRSRDLLLLLGAGASAEAGIPTSAAMITEIEGLLKVDKDWKPFARLYDHVKSAIFYSAGLQGRFNADVSYNIETLVNTLYELERNEHHPIYPFIASWNSRFLDLAGRDLCEIPKFRELILEKLKSWMCPEDGSKAAYYNGIRSLQQDLNYPLRIFSLNYDMCVEDLEDDKFRVETGFPGAGPESQWDRQRFAELEGAGDPLPEVFLYKLHGSINWKRDADSGALYKVKQVQTVTEMEVIFGREFKLEAGDPFLFYAYEFRKLSAEAKLVVTLGYGFADPHINKILSQALKEPTWPALAIVSNCSGDEQQVWKNEVAARLKAGDGDRILMLDGSASKILNQPDLAKTLQTKMPLNMDAFASTDEPGPTG